MEGSTTTTVTRETTADGRRLYVIEEKCSYTIYAESEKAAEAAFLDDEASATFTGVIERDVYLGEGTF